MPGFLFKNENNLPSLWNTCSTEKAATAKLTGEISKEPELEEYINQQRPPREHHSGISADLRGVFITHVPACQ
jgi:hypothetical protein